MDKPVLSKQAFTGLDMHEIDYENAILNVLERIIYKGTLDDFKAIRKFYGDNRIRKEVIRSKCFGPKEINFCCFIFKLKPADFKHHNEGRFRAFPEFKNCPQDLEYINFA